MLRLIVLKSHMINLLCFKEKHQDRYKIILFYNHKNRSSVNRLLYGTYFVPWAILLRNLPEIKKGWMKIHSMSTFWKVVELKFSKTTVVYLTSSPQNHNQNTVLQNFLKWIRAYNICLQNSKTFGSNNRKLLSL